MLVHQQQQLPTMFTVSRIDSAAGIVAMRLRQRFT
jgi:hypothetical protein